MASGELGPRGGLELTAADVSDMHLGIGAWLIERSPRPHNASLDRSLGLTAFNDVTLHEQVAAFLREDDENRGGQDPAWLPRDPSQSPDGSALLL